MHPVKAFFDQQQKGLVNKSIEPFLPRLRCLQKDEFSQIYPIQSFHADTPIFACKFSDKKNYENLLALADEDGRLAIHDVLKEKDRLWLHPHNNAIFDLTWLFQNLKIVTASGDHSSKLLDISNCEIREERTFFRHERSVKSLASSREDPGIFATGGRDGNIILWDIRADNSNATFIAKSDKIISNPHVSEALTPKSKKKASLLKNSSVTGLVFKDSNNLISCGAGDGCIKIWDLRKTHYDVKKKPIPKVTIPYPGKSAKNGFSNLVIDSACHKLYANCLDNNIYCYDIGTYNTNPIMTYSGHQNNTFYVKSALNRESTHLICGSSDGNGYIWNLKYSEPICQLVGHTAEVTCVAWCHTVETCIVTCSDDIKHKLWRIGSEDLPDNFEIEGKTEILPMYTYSRKPNLKRLTLNSESFRGTPKKFIASCLKCSCSENETLCENCNYSNKRKLSDHHFNSKKLHLNIGSRELFPPLEDQIKNTNKRQYDDTLSPLKDLPNFVMDGVAPHLNFSPPKKKHCDWLTKMRIENGFKRKMSENTDCPVTKMSKVETISNSKSLNKNIIQKSSLLNYFKITNNSIKCDKHPNLLRICYNCDKFDEETALNN